MNPDPDLRIEMNPDPDPHHRTQGQTLHRSDVIDNRGKRQTNRKIDRQTDTEIERKLLI